MSSTHDAQVHSAHVQGRFQWRDTGLGFSPVTIALHWIVAALVLAIIVIEIALVAAPDAELARVLNLLGAILFPISVYRFWARLTSWHPLPLGTPNPVEVIVSRSVATALALAMVLLPVAAWLAKSAAGQLVELPGGWIIPSPMPPSPQAAQVFEVLFKIGATPFVLGLALHIFGACKNHFVLKNDALKRMLGKRVEL
ncbi:Cytochrome b561 (plasmid) [Paraburkholderia caribensis MBA4]|uniref:Cytochrome b561 n=1 Tax=Paraburkholderia caribensis MBA4 TaxID=1323664 RepID=A0A0P0RR15_9BURK|nr:cytochrome b/b6 domain-containing protein [Paraburkholderia caribensis]ALL71511.1 Cytochrome b561 [Paraburkholderia caribensis MBA4]